MAETDEEKTEEATAFRREEFRKKGQVAQTREMGTVLALLSSALLLLVMGRVFVEQTQKILKLGLTDFIARVHAGAPLGEVMAIAGFEGMKILVPVLILFGVVAVLATVMQVGIIQNEEAFDPSLDRVNPLQGIKKVFSLRAVMEGVKSLVKVLLIGIVLYKALKSDLAIIPYLGDLSLQELMVYLGKTLGKILVSIGIFMAILAAGDYFFQRWQLEKQMRMTKQEVKEEMKSREGDPLIKARIRRIQREMANRRMMDEIPTADVVITNPTHIAVVLRYDPEKTAAPLLVAKGADFVAEKIRNLAREHNIPIVENKPLARTIYKTLKIGQVIPRDLFNAVAQVLSYVYRLKRKRVKV